MDTFWLKIAGAVVAVLVGGVLLFSFLSSKVKDAVDYEQMERQVEAQEAKLQADLAEAERKALEAKAEKERAQQEKLEQAQARQEQSQQSEPNQANIEPTSPEPVTLPPQPDEMGQTIQNVEAARLYEWAETEFRIARKPLMSFKRCVDFCRQIIQRWPDSPEAAKARVLLRRVPERHRRLYNVTDEEMGLTKQ